MGRKFILTFENEIYGHFSSSQEEFMEEQHELLGSGSFVYGDANFFVSLEVEEELDFLLIVDIKFVHDEFKLTGELLVVVVLYFL